MKSFSLDTAETDGPLTSARGGCGVGLRGLDDARGDEFGQQVVDVDLTEVVLWGGDLRSCRDTTDRQSEVRSHRVL